MNAFIHTAGWVALWAAVAGLAMLAVIGGLSARPRGDQPPAAGETSTPPDVSQPPPPGLTWYERTQLAALTALAPSPAAARGGADLADELRSLFGPGGPSDEDLARVCLVFYRHAADSGDQLDAAAAIEWMADVAAEAAAYLTVLDRSETPAP